MWSKRFKPWIRRAAKFNTDCNNCKRDQGTRTVPNYVWTRINYVSNKFADSQVRKLRANKQLRKKTHTNKPSPVNFTLIKQHTRTVPNCTVLYTYCTKLYGTVHLLYQTSIMNPTSSPIVRFESWGLTVTSKNCGTWAPTLWFRIKAFYPPISSDCILLSIPEERLARKQVVVEVFIQCSDISNN